MSHFDESELEKAFFANLESIKNQGIRQEEDEIIMKVVKKMDSMTEDDIPEPTEIEVSTQSAMCRMSEKPLKIHLGKLVSHFSKKILDSYFDGKKKYPIQGLTADEWIIRYDEAFITKHKRPYIKFHEELVNPYVKEDCYAVLDKLVESEKRIQEKQGRQKEKKDGEHFYNSCSVIVKPSKHSKCINIKFFNNGRITLTGSKEEDDGLRACEVFLEEMKKEPSIFIDMSSEEIEALQIENYEVTMINSGFCLNFKVDLNALLNGIQRDYPNVYTKFNPEKYRGLIIGYFWNQEKGKEQDGICRCGEERCKGKGKGIKLGECKKVTISVFKSGETIITGARSMHQIRLAYRFFMGLVKQYFKSIMKLSVMDYMEKPNDDIDFDEMEKYIQEEEKKLKTKKKKPMKS